MKSTHFYVMGVLWAPLYVELLDYKHASKKRKKRIIDYQLWVTICEVLDIKCKID